VFSTLWNIIALGIAVIGGILAFGFARGFIRNRLRFVDSARSPLVPWVAGGIALLVAAPFTLLPLVSGTTVAVVGLGAGLGARSGVTALRGER
jgi:hypothetical protein